MSPKWNSLKQTNKKTQLNTNLFIRWRYYILKLKKNLTNVLLIQCRLLKLWINQSLCFFFFFLAIFSNFIAHNLSKQCRQKKKLNIKKSVLHYIHSYKYVSHNDCIPVPSIFSLKTSLKNSPILHDLYLHTAHNFYVFFIFFPFLLFLFVPMKRLLWESNP